MSDGTTVRRTVYFTMVNHPLKGWVRVGNAYSSRKTAQGWLGFVRTSAWVSHTGSTDERCARSSDGRRGVMSANRYDCWLTPPCAARALGTRDLPRTHWLDPFGAAGTLPPWAFGMRPLSPEVYAFDIDTRWQPELRANVLAMNTRLGHDSLAMDWRVRDVVPHVVTNPPFGMTREALAKCRAHAYEHERYACVLMRTDWWQHRERSTLRPDHMLLLEWRPAFGLNREGRLSTDYAGYVWCVYEPRATGRTEVAFLARPEVPDELRAEHKRLARLANQMGAAMAQGA